MTAEGLLTALREKGVEVVAAGDRLRFRPLDLVTAEEREELRRLKADLLTLLAPPAAVHLVAQTVADVLGSMPAPSALEALRREVTEAVDALVGEIRAAAVQPRLRLVRGRPLADWLELDDVAAILRAWRDRTGRR